MEQKSGAEVYVFGFNGMEKDNEVNGESNSLNFGGRTIYNPRIARFYSTDPISEQFPFYSPYLFAGNKPIICKDEEGLSENMIILQQEWHTAEVLSKTNGRTVEENFNAISTARREALKPMAVGVALGVGLCLDALIFKGNIIRFIFGYTVGTAVDYGEKSAKAKAEGNIPLANEYAEKSKEAYKEVAFMVVAPYALKQTFKAIVNTRITLARQFYEKFGESNIASKLAGIDFFKPVSTTILKAGTTVEQWVGADGAVGKYFAPVGSDASTLGINTAGRELKQFKLTEDVKVLKSTAADYKDPISGQTYKGGGTQYFNPEVKNVATPVGN